MNAGLARYLDYLQTLTPQSLAQLEAYVAPDILFRDPFHETRGPAAMRDIFANMFRQLHAPGFVIEDSVQQDSRAYIKWKMHFAFRHAKKRQHGVTGVTELHVAPDGRVQAHLDYWDAAHGFYTYVPVLGGLMRALRKAVAGKHA